MSPVPSGPSASGFAAALAVGDFNGDGIPDLVTLDRQTGYLNVYLGDGKGGFLAPISTKDPAAGFALYPAYLVVGDFDGNGNLDVALANPNEQTLEIWTGNGDGTLEVSGSYTVDAGPLAVADFNGDGAADIAMGGDSTGAVYVFLNNGDGTFGPPAQYSLLDGVAGSTIFVAAGDIDGNGTVDLVAVASVMSPTTPFSDNLIAVLPGNGDGSFQPASYILDSVNAQESQGGLTLGDLNGDGALDVVIQNGSNSRGRCSLTVLMGNGKGGFGVPERYLCSDGYAASVDYQTSADGSPEGVAIGDFNGDGRPDVVALFAYNTGYLQLFPGNGDGTFQPAAIFLVPGTSLAPVAAPFRGDGRMGFAIAPGAGMSTAPGDVIGAVEGTTGAFLSISEAHNGAIAFGQQGVSFTITVGDSAGASAASGTISVTDEKPEYALITSMSGDGWNCSLMAWTCSRSDSLAAGSSYPPITVMMSVGGGGVSPLINGAVVSGGGSPPSEAQLSLLLAPASTLPAISSVETADGTAPGATGSAISQNDWIEIYGVNLVPATAPASGVTWSNAPDFASGLMPTQLGGVTVTVDGKPAYVAFFCSAVTDPACTSDQINVLTPLDGATGPVQIVVTSGASSTPPFSVNLQPVSPALLLFSGAFAAATHADYSLVGPELLYPGLSSPAHPGETILLWGVGFGLPTGPILAGSSSQSGPLPSAVSCAVNSEQAAALVNLISPGLYQINLSIPVDIVNGNAAVVCTYQGISTPSVLLAIQN